MWPRDDISQGTYAPPPTKNDVGFSASQAKKLAEAYHSEGGDLYKNYTLKIMKEIEDAARRGGRALYITKYFEQLDFSDRKAVQGHLERAGYEVESTYDQRDGDYHKVTW